MDARDSNQQRDVASEALGRRAAASPPWTTVDAPASGADAVKPSESGTDEACVFITSVFHLFYIFNF